MAGTLVITTLSDGTSSTSATDIVNGSAKAWVNFNGTGTVAIRASYTVSSITDNGTGDYTVNFTNAFADTNYVALVSAGNASDTPNIDREAIIAYTTTTCQMVFVNSGVANIDPTFVNFAAFR